MFASLAVVLALAVQPPAAPVGGLSLTNVRSTHGNLGGTRPAGPLIPGDVLFLAFDIDGMTVDKAGKAAYVMAMDVLDGAGKVIHKQDPASRADFVPLGGGRLPGQAFITVGLDQPAGDYRMKVSVTDNATQAKQALEYKFTVAPKDFAVVAVYASVDERGQIPAPTTAVVGQSPFVQCGVVGFALGADKKPNVSLEMTPLDEKGVPLLGEPSTLKFNTNIDEKDPSVAARFLVPLTRAGKFSVRLKATDLVGKKTAVFTLPMTVLSPAN